MLLCHSWDRYARYERSFCDRARLLRSLQRPLYRTAVRPNFERLACNTRIGLSEQGVHTATRTTIHLGIVIACSICGYFNSHSCSKCFSSVPARAKANNSSRSLPSLIFTKVFLKYLRSASRG